MSKYDSLKYWARTKARITHYCRECGALVKQGDFYYKEKIDFVHPPNIALGEVCDRCCEKTSTD